MAVQWVFFTRNPNEMWRYAGTTMHDEILSEEEDVAEEEGAEFKWLALEIPDEEYHIARPGSGLNKSGETTPRVITGEGAAVELGTDYKEAL